MNHWTLFWNSCIKHPYDVGSHHWLHTRRYRHTTFPDMSFWVNLHALRSTTGWQSISPLKKDSYAQVLPSYTTWGSHQAKQLVHQVQLFLEANQDGVVLKRDARHAFTQWPSPIYWMKSLSHSLTCRHTTRSGRCTSGFNPLIVFHS